MKDLEKQLDTAYKNQTISQEAYLEQKTQYKAQMIILNGKYNEASQVLEAEIHGDLLASKEGLAFIWVNQLERSQEIYDIKTGVIRLPGAELQELIKYLNTQNVIPGRVKRIGLKLNEHTMYVMMIFGNVLSKIFAVFNRNPGQILDITIQQLSESIEENFKAVLDNPKIIMGDVLTILFQDVSGEQAEDNSGDRPL